jgi:hypothetical protein
VAGPQPSLLGISKSADVLERGFWRAIWHWWIGLKTEVKVPVITGLFAIAVAIVAGIFNLGVTIYNGFKASPTPTPVLSAAPLPSPSSTATSTPSVMPTPSLPKTATFTYYTSQRILGEWRSKLVPQENTLPIKENPFTVSVPRVATNARLTVPYGSQLLTVTMGQTSDPLIFVSQQDNGGKEKELPVHHKLEEILDHYLKATGLEKEPQSPLFPAALGKSGKRSRRLLARTDAADMLKRGLSKPAFRLTIRRIRSGQPASRIFWKMTAPLKPLNASPATPTAGPRSFMTAAARRFCSRIWRGFGIRASPAV